MSTIFAQRGLISIIIFLATMSTIFAQQKSKDNFQVFWKTWEIALRKDDKATLASLTQFPFYYINEDINTEKELLKRYNDFFDKETKKSLLTQKPIKSNKDYIIESGYIIYTFSKTDDGWKFISIYEWDD